MWEHTFICLSSKAQSSPPGPMERGRLIQAGLGDKPFSMYESNDAEDLHQDLLEAFPKFIVGGGYELLRTSQYSNQTLEVIPSPPSGTQLST